MKWLTTYVLSSHPNNCSWFQWDMNNLKPVDIVNNWNLKNQVSLSEVSSWTTILSLQPCTRWRGLFLRWKSWGRFLASLGQSDGGLVAFSISEKGCGTFQEILTSASSSLQFTYPIRGTLTTTRRQLCNRTVPLQKSPPHSLFTKSDWGCLGWSFMITGSIYRKFLTWARHFLEKTQFTQPFIRCNTKVSFCPRLQDR